MPKPRVPRHEVTQPSDPSYRLIPLTQGQNAIVDTEDYDWLNQWNWFADWCKCTQSFYARRHKKTDDGRYPIVRMSREILQCDPGKEPDHKNHDTLDNRKENLRLSTHSQNCCNKRISPKNTSGFIGVHWQVKNRRWVARIQYKGKRIPLGCYATAEEAAHAYDRMAIKLHSDFAILNFPREQYK